MHFVGVGARRRAFALVSRRGTMTSMARAVDRILEEARRLAPDERAEVVTELLTTLEPDVPGQLRAETDWVQEIERRAREALAGGAAVSWADAKASIQSRLSSR
jgi:hypothetical protein